MNSRIILVLVLCQILYPFCLGTLTTKIPKATIRTILHRQASASSTITIPPAQILQLNSACLILGETLSICQSATLDFTSLDETAQAGCLCYSSTDWQPDVFDTAVAGCADFAAMAIGGTVEGVIQGLVGFCGSVGNVVRFTTVPGTSSTVVEVMLTTSLSVLMSTGPDITAVSILPLLTAQASATPIQTATSSIALQGIETSNPGTLTVTVISVPLVNSVPSVIPVPSISLVPTPPAATTTAKIPLPLSSGGLSIPLLPSSTLINSSILTTPAPTFSLTVTTTTQPPDQQGCILFSSILSTCTAATTSFTVLGAPQQASCLCYVTGIWVPNAFDGAINGCSSSDAGVYSSTGGFCAGIGNRGTTLNSPTNTSEILPIMTTLSSAGSRIIPSVSANSVGSDEDTGTSTTWSITSILVVPLPMSTWSSSSSSSSSSLPSTQEYDTDTINNSSQPAAASSSQSEFTIFQTLTSTSPSPTITSEPTTTFLEISKPSTTAEVTTSSGLSQVLNGLGSSSGVGLASNNEVVVVSAGLAMLVLFL